MRTEGTSRPSAEMSLTSTARSLSKKNRPPAIVPTLEFSLKYLCLMSYVLCLMSYILCLISYILYLISYNLSYILCLMSYVSYVLCLMSYDMSLMLMTYLMHYVLYLIHLMYLSLMLGRVMLTCDSFALVGWTSTPKGGSLPFRKDAFWTDRFPGIAARRRNASACYKTGTSVRESREKVQVNHMRNSCRQCWHHCW